MTGAPLEPAQHTAHFNHRAACAFATSRNVSANTKNPARTANAGPPSPGSGTAWTVAVSEEIAKQRPGTKVAVTYLRDSEFGKVDVILGRAAK